MDKIKLPICPICKKEMWVEWYEGYYEDFKYWRCSCSYNELPKFKTKYMGLYV